MINMSQQVLKLTEEQLQALLESGALEEMEAEETPAPSAPPHKPVSKISVGIHAKSSKSLPDSAVDIVRFVQILKMNLNIDFAVDVSVGVNPTLATSDPAGKSPPIGFAVSASDKEVQTEESEESEE